MDETMFTASNFMPKDLIKSSAFLREVKSVIRIKLY